MPDREKVIKGLECHQIDKDHRINCSDCPYHCDEFMNGLNELHNDALELLKEQEAEVEPKRMYHDERASFDNYLCECKSELYYTQRYCDVCGRSVKWE